MTTSAATSDTFAGNFGNKSELANTGMGVKNSDGTANCSRTLQGVSAADFGTTKKLPGKSWKMEIN